MNNGDDLDSGQIKLEQEELSIKIEPGEVTEENNSFVAIMPEEICVEDAECVLKTESDSNNDCDNDKDCMSSDIEETTVISTLDSLPPKSKERYKLSYKQFMDWRKMQEINTSFSENTLLAYFGELSGKNSPNTLWTHYSMLKSTLAIHENVYIAQYLKLKALLKKKLDGYQPKKSKSLTMQEIHTFLNTAPDAKYLLVKVVLTIGISGACQKHEIAQIKVDDIEDLNSAVLIKIPNTKTKTKRSFAMTDKFYDLYKKYAALRPPATNERRFLLNYQNQKCTGQPVGVHKIAGVPKQIATFLRLKQPELYTCHCFRRSSATMIVNAGGDITTPKFHEDTSITEDYTDQIKSKPSQIIVNYFNNSSEFPTLSENSIGSNTQFLTAEEGIENGTNKKTFQTSKHCITLYNCSNKNVVINFINEMKE